MSNLKVPEHRARATRSHIMRATLPSTAQMLTDLRTILVNQISQHAKDANSELFDASRVKALAQLAQTLVLLEKQTSEEQDKMASALEDLSPEEQSIAEAQARALLSGIKG